MQAMRVRRLSDSVNNDRLYLDGRRVSRADWDAAHLARTCDTFASRLQTQRDGRELVREYHCIRPRKG